MGEDELLQQIKQEVLKELKEWAIGEIREMVGKKAA
ncbi:MAG: hypothetical protein APG08_00388 [Candidatus Methanofastidiosum methylothiophilum]|uniref:Uncharacterized protein n=1 Tax=Candidatus Methanofastidiosum methylothiophilum TaxID=1705564 RepID=A0A150JIP1_9EURY|nr:MAG: hypothetical protein AN188_00240 [Candidatus Methanofastidiosum methylthiophilus]KYC57107.1 MAG: hypothetical protein APG08_00388 [Candidatus Methanofastidiosum methylthiophilus]OQC52525.1 MAG: hypothetical protein BWX56_00242 [Euryarchaeota archaeon ADurb.Bin023]